MPYGKDMQSVRSKGNIKLLGFAGRKMSEKRRALVSKEYKQFCESKNIDIEYCTPRILNRSSRKANAFMEGLDIS